MNYKYIISIIILFQYSCFKDEETVTKTIIKEKPTIVLANNKVVVHVTDEQGQSLNGITANFNNTIKIINNDSYFYFNGINVNKENELLLLTDASGEAYEYSIYSIENDVNYIDVSLYQGYDKNTISSQSAIQYKISDNITVDLLADNYSVGQSKYTGNITIKSNEYDLKNKNHLNALPSIGLININGAWSKMEIQTAFRFDVLDTESRKIDFKTAVNCQFQKNIDDGYHLLYYDNKNHEWIIQSALTTATKTIPILKSGLYAIASIQEAAVVKGQFSINGDFPKNMSVEIKYDNQIISTKTSNTARIVLPNNTEIIKVELLDATTKICLSQIYSNTDVLDLSSLSSGLYVVKITEFNGNNYIGKLLKY